MLPEYVISFSDVKGLVNAHEGSFYGLTNIFNMLEELSLPVSSRLVDR